MIFLLIAILAGACAWKPVIHTYPSGLKIKRVDQDTLDKICTSRVGHFGEPILHAAGCYDRKTDTIWVRNDYEGARALTHELAHREGVKNPTAEGFDWK